jgi:hypothetical protein
MVVVMVVFLGCLQSTLTSSGLLGEPGDVGCPGIYDAFGPMNGDIFPIDVR